MFGLKSVYFYLIACQIILIKFFKKIYFSSKNYNKSLRSKTPKQIYYNPNPFLLSVIARSHGQIFKISDIDPNIFWLEDNLYLHFSHKGVIIRVKVTICKLQNWHTCENIRGTLPCSLSKCAVFPT